jgi:hypothetical protein
VIATKEQEQEFNIEHWRENPIAFGKLCWPDMNLYGKQREIIFSVRDNVETYVPAGNQLGKDFVSAFIALWFFCSRRPARVVTTSVKGAQLDDVLWGEIRGFIQNCKIRLPFQYNHLHIRQIHNDGTFVPKAELVGQVVSKGESMLGRHLPKDIPRTLAIFDEASGIDTDVYEKASTWAHRLLIIGNPFPCNNFFFTGVKAGDVKALSTDHYQSKVIKIRALDSPNIQLSQAEERTGKKVTNKILIPGLIDYNTYQTRRELWDVVRQCVSLDGEFYEGAEVLLFPPDWLNKAELRAEKITARGKLPKILGVDTAEGGDNTCWTVIDKLGILEMVSMKTPDTSIIPGRTLAMMKQYNIGPRDVLFDQGGGGQEHADRLRSQGHNVKTVSFGGAVTPEKRRGVATIDKRMREQERKYVYKNRRAEMYGELRIRLHPEADEPFAIPAKYTELRRQLSVIPLMYDEEGKIELPPKNKRDPNSKKVTLMELIGHSPDEADALVLAVFGLRPRKTKRVLGKLF